jgi:hypothetical protein
VRPDKREHPKRKDNEPEIARDLDCVGLRVMPFVGYLARYLVDYDDPDDDYQNGE